MDTHGRIESIKHLANNNPGRVYILVTEDDKDNFIKCQGILESEMSLISSLPKSPRSVGQRRTGKIMKFVPKRHGLPATHWVELSDDEDIDGVYVDIMAYKINGYANPSNLNDHIKHMTELGIKVPTIYGIKKGYETDCEYLENYLQEELAEWHTKHLDRIQNYYNLESLQDQGKWLSLKKHKNIECPEILDLFTKILDSDPKIYAFKTLCSNYSFKHGTVADKEIKKIEKNLLAKYPMLGILSAWDIEQSKKVVVDYLNFVNACCGQTL